MMVYHIYNPKTGKMSPILDKKGIEDYPPTIKQCREIAAELKQDLNIINNASLIINYLCDKIERSENE